MVDAVRKGIWGLICAFGLCLPGFLLGGLLFSGWKWAALGAALNLGAYLVGMIFIEQLVAGMFVPAKELPGGLEPSWRQIAESQGVPGARLGVINTPNLLFLPLRAIGGRGLVLLSRSYIGLSSEVSLTRDLRFASSMLRARFFWGVSFSFLALIALRSFSPEFWDWFFLLGFKASVRSRFSVSFPAHSSDGVRPGVFRFIVFLLFLPPSFCLIQLGKVLMGETLSSVPIEFSPEAGKRFEIAEVLSVKNLVNIFAQR